MNSCPVCKELPFDNIECPESFSELTPMSAECANALTRIMIESLEKKFQIKILDFNDDNLDLTGIPFDTENNNE